MGTVDDCRQFVFTLADIGVDEIACLIDFLDDYDAVLESLEYLATLNASLSGETVRRESEIALTALMDSLEV
jgi:hypothetical protein